MWRSVMAMALATGLLGCAGEPGVERVDLNPYSEKAVLEGLTKVKASKEQRIAVLNAFDSRNGELVALEKSSEGIIDRWYKLDRKAPDYLQQVDALALQWARANSDEMKARGAYEHELAATLSTDQWNTFQDFMITLAVARRRAEQNEAGFGGPHSRY